MSNTRTNQIKEELEREICCVKNSIGDSFVSAVYNEGDNTITFTTGDGGTQVVTITGGTDGNGIYTGSGSIPDGTVATVADSGRFTFDYFGGNHALRFDIDNLGGTQLYSPDNTKYLNVSNSGIGIVGDLNMGSYKITSLLDPVSNQDAATKNYVDNFILGASWKTAVRAATTVAGTLATSFANGQTIDDVVLATGDRILIKNQVTGSENGIYIVTVGAPTRSTDADSGSELVSATVPVSEGTVNADTFWTCTNNYTVVLGVTSLTFVQISGLGTYTAGSGLSLVGNVFSVSTPYLPLVGYGYTNTTSNALSLTGNNLTTAGLLSLSSNSLTTGALGIIVVNSTGAASNSQTGLSISTLGANSNSTQTTYGLDVSNTHTGTSSTNVAARFTASGGTNNYAINIGGGLFSINGIDYKASATDKQLVVNSVYNSIDTSPIAYILGGGANGWPNKIGSTGFPNGTGATPTDWSADVSYVTGAADVALICGGYDNIVNQEAGVIVGGGHNFIKYNTNAHSIIGGGSYNVISAGRSGIFNGSANTITGNKLYSFIGSGYNNNIVGSYSVIPGGQANNVTGDYSLAWGTQAKVTASGSTLLKDATAVDFTLSKANSFALSFSGGVGVNTGSPQETVHIVSTETGAGSALLRLDNTGTASNETGMEFWCPPSDATTSLRAGRIYSKFDGASYTNTRLTLQGVTSGNTLVDALTIRAANSTFSNQLIVSTNGALSAPAVSLTGSVITGGTGTTTVPYMLIQSTGTTAATDWSVNGTEFGINAVTGFSGKLLDLRVGGTSQLSISSSGGIDATGVISSSLYMQVGATQFFRMMGRSRIYSPGNGLFTLTDDAATGFTRLNFGGATTSYPAWTVSGANMVLTDGAGTYTSKLGIQGLPVSALTIPVAPTATANYGLLSLGSAPFDGSTSGYFQGSANGTLIAVNAASGSTSDLMNLQVGGVSKFKVTNSGLTTVAGAFATISFMQVGSTYNFQWDSRSMLLSPSDGVIGLYNNANTDFNRLQFGGQTSSFPAWARDAANFRLVDASNGNASGLGIGESLPASAKLSVASTTQGFLPPRMTTTQKNAISSPAEGLLLYDTDLRKLCVYTGTWETVTSL